MNMEIDFVAYMWVIGILFVLVAVAGGIVAALTIREHNRRREESMGYSSSLRTWDAESPNSFSSGVRKLHPETMRR